MLLSTKQLAEKLNISPDTLREIQRQRPDFPGRVTRTRYSWPQVYYWLLTAPSLKDPLEEAKDILAAPEKKKRVITKDW